jgi:hypothetical protein
MHETARHARSREGASHQRDPGERQQRAHEATTAIGIHGTWWPYDHFCLTARALERVGDRWACW